jgi:hypothetical protein
VASAASRVDRSKMSPVKVVNAPQISNWILRWCVGRCRCRWRFSVGEAGRPVGRPCPAADRTRRSCLSLSTATALRTRHLYRGVPRLRRRSIGVGDHPADGPVAGRRPNQARVDNRFGGRVGYLVGEYVKLGLLPHRAAQPGPNVPRAMDIICTPSCLSVPGSSG